MAVVTNFFKGADADRDHKIGAAEVDEFVTRLELVFKSLPGFDASVIKDHIIRNGLSTKEMKSIVDIIVGFGEAANSPPPPQPVLPVVPAADGQQ